jgi:hypothetical protein
MTPAVLDMTTFRFSMPRLRTRELQIPLNSEKPAIATLTAARPRIAVIYSEEVVQFGLRQWSYGDSIQS